MKGNIKKQNLSSKVWFLLAFDHKIALYLRSPSTPSHVKGGEAPSFQGCFRTYTSLVGFPQAGAWPLLERNTGQGGGLVSSIRTWAVSWSPIELV